MNEKEIINIYAGADVAIHSKWCSLISFLKGFIDVKPYSISHWIGQRERRQGSPRSTPLLIMRYDNDRSHRCSFLGVFASRQWPLTMRNTPTIRTSHTGSRESPSKSSMRLQTLTSTLSGIAAVHSFTFNTNNPAKCQFNRMLQIASIWQLTYWPTSAEFIKNLQIYLFLWLRCSVDIDGVLGCIWWVWLDLVLSVFFAILS